MKTMIKQYTVTADKTAQAMGSGGLQVLATPALVAMIENACYLSLQEELSVGQTSVGAQISLDHVAPSKVNAVILVEVHQAKNEGPKVTFEYAAYDGERLIGKGSHQRFIVNQEKFLAKLS